MDTDGGGWVVFQRRMDGTVDFYRNWADYVKGFGDLNGEFWLGLSKIHRLTQAANTTLRVDLADFEGEKRHANYSTFKLPGLLQKIPAECRGPLRRCWKWFDHPS